MTTGGETTPTQTPPLPDGALTSTTTTPNPSQPSTTTNNVGDDPSSSSSQLQFTVLYGAHSSSTPPCYLLEVSGCKILLDCGWDSNFDVKLLEPLERVARDVKLVLISHPDVEHMGALPYAYAKFKLQAQTYITSASRKLGHLSLYDAVLSGSAPYTLDDVDFVMNDKSHGIKYQQLLEIALGGGKEKIVVTPHAAGRNLGGAVWRVSQEPSLNVLYASDVAQRRQKFVDGLDMQALGKGPTLLIQDALGLTAMKPAPSITWGAESVASRFQVSENLKGEALRDASFCGLIVEALRRGGDVLVPVDTCGRAFEVLMVLDELWKREGLEKAYDLVFLTKVSSVFDVASSNVEFSSKKIQERIDKAGENAFRVAKVIVLDSPDVAILSQGRPRVMVCSGLDMGKNSPSREIFARRVAHRPESLVVLVCPSVVTNSVASQLFQGLRLVTTEEEAWQDLQGDELMEWQQRKRVRLEEAERERQTENDISEFRADASHEGGGDGAPSSALMASSNGEGDYAAAGRNTGKILSSSSQHAQKLGETDFSSSRHFQPFAQALIEPEDGQGYYPMFGLPSSTLNLIDGWDMYGAFVSESALMDENAKRELARGQKATNPSSMDVEEEEAAAEKQRQAKLKEEEAKRQREQENSLPRKRVTISLQLAVSCRVEFVSFEARATEEDLRAIVGLVKPKKLVVVRAGIRESERFANDCHNQAYCGVGLSPAPGECLDVAANSSVVRVRVPLETVVSCPPLSKLAGTTTTVQRVRARIALLSLAAQSSSAAAAGSASSSSSASHRSKRVAAVAGGEIPSILPAPVGTKLALDGECWWVSKGEPQLLAVRKRLQAAGIPTRFHADGGVLLCGAQDDVAVWKPPGGGRLLVTGGLGDSYFDVRRIVYEGFALV